MVTCFDGALHIYAKMGLSIFSWQKFDRATCKIFVKVEIVGLVALMEWLVAHQRNSYHTCLVAYQMNSNGWWHTINLNHPILF